MTSAGCTTPNPSRRGVVLLDATQSEENNIGNPPSPRDAALSPCGLQCNQRTALLLTIPRQVSGTGSFDNSRPRYLCLGMEG